MIPEPEPVPFCSMVPIKVCTFSVTSALMATIAGITLEATLVTSVEIRPLSCAFVVESFSTTASPLLETEVLTAGYLLTRYLEA